MGRHDPCDDEAIKPTPRILRSPTAYHLTAGKPPRGDSLSKRGSAPIAELHRRYTAETVETVLLRRTDPTASA